MNVNEELKRFLPIGTIVLLKGATKRLMITGFCSVPSDDKSKIFDYTGCLYPEGVINSKEIALFNHNQIEKIYFVGYRDEEEKQFKEKLNDLISKAQNLALNNQQNNSSNNNS